MLFRAAQLKGKMREIIIHDTVFIQSLTVTVDINFIRQLSDVDFKTILN